jgi:hypothetical protein
MTEPDVAITDYLIAIEAAIFAALIYRSADASADLRGPFVLFFSATAAAAAAGGTVHGFFARASAGPGRALWRLTMLALGVAAFAAWLIGARMLSGGLATIVEWLAGAVALVYAAVVLTLDDRFAIAIVHYLPPALFLLIVFVLRLFDGGAGAFAGAGGMLLTFAAALVQQRQVALHRVYFNHNAVYHAIQAVAMGLLFWSAKQLFGSG